MPRTVEILQILAPLLAAVAVVLLITRRKLIERLLYAGATAEAAAIDLPASSPPMRFWRARLTRAGVIVARGDGRVWLDVGEWRQYRSARRRRGIAIAAGLLLLVTALIVLGSRGGT